MGLYIPKMKMPKNCYDCQIENDVPNCPVYMYYSATEYMEERHPDCPLVEIQEPHGRLIDADEIPIHREGYDYVAYLDSIAEMPTVIEAEGE